MENDKFYSLPSLGYGYKDLEPHISEEQLKIHHQKHHQAYVDGANKIFENLDKIRTSGAEADIKSLLKSLSFNIGGHILHSLFWRNLGPAKESGEAGPGGPLLALINRQFGNFENFKKEFSQAAVSAEGSGWAALVLEKETGRLLAMQIEKHNVNIYPACEILMVLDVWEHAYYLDYKNARADFVAAFWHIVNWEEVERRLETLLNSKIQI